MIRVDLLENNVIPRLNTIEQRIIDIRDDRNSHSDWNSFCGCPMKIIQLGFGYNRYGEAAALGTILTVIATVFILVFTYAMRGETYEY